MEKKKRSLMWFRKGLRLHDNPALLQACEGARNVYPVFVLDPWFLAPDPSAPSPGSRLVGVNRIRFLLESLQDLDTSLRNCGSRLLLIHGSPISIIPHLLTKVHTILSSIAANCETYANTCKTHSLFLLLLFAMLGHNHKYMTIFILSFFGFRGLFCVLNFAVENR
jgi:deoxyribodipyrimidine photolyase